MLTLKASNKPPATFCASKNSRFTNLIDIHMWESGVCDDRIKSSTACMIMKRTKHKCTCTRRSPYSDYSTGWTIEESWFDSRQEHLTFTSPRLARPALGSSQPPTLSAQALPTAVKQPGSATDHPPLYLHSHTPYEVQERYYLYTTINISDSAANFSPIW